MKPNSFTRTKTFPVFLGSVVLLFLEIISYRTGPEISLTLFYLVPVGIFVWLLGRWAGIFLASASVMAWLVTKLMVGSVYSTPMITYWNLTVRVVFFIVIIILLSGLKRALERERSLSRTDFTTGIANRRYFFEVVEMEINKARRYHHPMTIGYMDIDNFKLVNDRSGHNAGDNLLRLVAGTVKEKIRSVDIVSRLGGDEFGVLLPETGHEAGKRVIEKIQESVNTLVQQNNLPVSLSMGVVTCTNPTVSADELIKKADDMMYLAKKEGKNRIKYTILGE